MRECVLDSSHPYHTLFQSILHLLCSSLNPSDLNNSLDHLPPQLSQLLARHNHHLLQRRETLDSLLTPLINSTSINTPTPSLPHPWHVDPLVMVVEEMKSCTLSEHEVAATLLCSSKREEVAFKTVQMALLKMSRRDNFNPFHEYRVGTSLWAGQEGRVWSQEALISAMGNIDRDGGKCIVSNAQQQQHTSNAIM